MKLNHTCFSLFALAAILLTNFASAVAMAPKQGADWYEPRESDFKALYERDSANMSKQAWKDYWSWVQCFYAGNLLDSGWTKRGKDLLSSVKKEEAKTALREKLNTLGRSLAAEWAKANEARKVDNAKLFAWGQRLAEAKKKDDGEGSAIQREIEKIIKEVDQSLANSQKTG